MIKLFFKTDFFYIDIRIQWWVPIYFIVLFIIVYLFLKYKIK